MGSSTSSSSSIFSLQHSCTKRMTMQEHSHVVIHFFTTIPHKAQRGGAGGQQCVQAHHHHQFFCCNIATQRG
jgi:hypothetical protein